MQSHAVVVVVCVRVCGGVFLTNVRIPAPLACERSPAKLGILLLLLCPIGSSFLCSHELSSCAFVCVCASSHNCTRMQLCCIEPEDPARACHAMECAFAGH